MSHNWFQESYHLLQYGAMTKLEGNFWGKVVIKFSHLLLSLSSAINILIYSYKVSPTLRQNAYKESPRGAASGMSRCHFFG